MIKTLSDTNDKCHRYRCLQFPTQLYLRLTDSMHKASDPALRFRSRASTCWQGICGQLSISFRSVLISYSGLAKTIP